MMRKVRALQGFTAFHEKMIVFNPAKNGTPATVESLPEKMAADYVDAGMAEYADAPHAAAPKGKGRSGKRRGKKAAASANLAADGPFTAKLVPVGKYEITGPGLAEPIVVKGKAAAAAKLDELNATADDGAPPVD